MDVEDACSDLPPGWSTPALDRLKAKLLGSYKCPAQAPAGHFIIPTLDPAENSAFCTILHGRPQAAWWKCINFIPRSSEMPLDSLFSHYSVCRALQCGWWDLHCERSTCALIVVSPMLESMPDSTPVCIFLLRPQKHVVPHDISKLELKSWCLEPNSQSSPLKQSFKLYMLIGIVCS